MYYKLVKRNCGEENLFTAPAHRMLLVQPVLFYANYTKPNMHIFCLHFMKRKQQQITKLIPFCSLTVPIQELSNRIKYIITHQLKHSVQLHPYQKVISSNGNLWINNFVIQKYSLASAKTICSQLSWGRGTLRMLGYCLLLSFVSVTATQTIFRCLYP